MIFIRKRHPCQSRHPVDQHILSGQAWESPFPKVATVQCYQLTLPEFAVLTVAVEEL